MAETEPLEEVDGAALCASGLFLPGSLDETIDVFSLLCLLLYGPYGFNFVMSIFLPNCLCRMVYSHDCPQPFPHCCPGACDSELPASLLGSEAMHTAHALAQTDPVEAVKMMASGSKECTQAE